ncbi:hypothetical protein LTR09_007487 [Extremus antarcticus]|uniref:Transglutaminase-like domain-containing protein n=1 Tax=Extremus antarcticus TaxID=702011 RepID=A0AAJ0DCK2_9PEZI|nr:hypothetical protein LTR09_007487 [Extremus antarcticus]
MAEDQPQSIQTRIAALKLNQVGRVPSGPPPSYEQTTNNTSTNSNGRPRPPPPPRPSLPARPNVPGRAASTNVPPTADYAPVSNGGISNLPEGGQPSANSNGMDGISRPALPPRTSTLSSQSSALPSRRTSEVPALPSRQHSLAPSTVSRRPSDYSLNRQPSNESISSIATARSGTSAISNGTSITSGRSDTFSIRAPTFDASALPALPPKRTQEEKEATYKKYNKAASTTSRFAALKATKSTPNVQQKQVGTTPPPAAPMNVLPAPGLPSRTPSIQEEDPPQPILPARPQRQVVEPPPPRKSALLLGLNSGTTTNPPVPAARPISVSRFDGAAAPPPIPAASKPDLAALQASKPDMNRYAAAPAATSCLLCRDFSGPDAHAQRFPRESLPTQDIGWVAQQLTAPFPSPTDKARALFTWLHHNISYDTVAFFNHNVKPSTPQSTLSSGLAVCEGYAGLFAAMAMKVGLEAVVVGGHGKGYGYSKLQPGKPLPAYKAGHAWNAAKIDGGQWKLIDCCWGAGTVNGKNQPYTKGFAPERFTQSNEDFGLDHFPGDNSKQFRNDGRVVGWEEYILGNKNGCGADFFSGFISGEGLTAKSFQPVSNPIVRSQIPGPTIRFSFQKKCPHWDPIRNGKGPYYLYVLTLSALEGTDRNHVPFETNGSVWWCDVPVADLGPPGSKVGLWAATSFDGADGRGLTIGRYRERRKWCSPGMGGVCKWEVA